MESKNENLSYAGFHSNASHQEENQLADMEKIKTWTIEEKRNMEINAKAMNALICALSPEEFNCISTYKTTKEIWGKLEVTHEGTKQVKETNS